MTKFFDLFARNSRRPDFLADPLWADRQFPATVAEGPFRLWRPGDAVSSAGVRVLVGIATWSGYDMRLLDLIAEGLGGAAGTVVEVFNTSDCRQHADFKKYIPDMGNV